MFRMGNIWTFHTQQSCPPHCSPPSFGMWQRLQLQTRPPAQRDTAVPPYCPNSHSLGLTRLHRARHGAEPSTRPHTSLGWLPLQTGSIGGRRGEVFVAAPAPLLKGSIALQWDYPEITPPRRFVFPCCLPLLCCNA